MYVKRLDINMCIKTQLKHWWMALYSTRKTAGTWVAITSEHIPNNTRRCALLCKKIGYLTLMVVSKIKSFPSLGGSYGSAALCFGSPQPDTSWSCKIMDTGLVQHVVCPFTPQLSLVLIKRPRSDGTLSWHWYTAATGGSRTRNLAIAKSGSVP